MYSFQLRLSRDDSGRLIPPVKRQIDKQLAFAPMRTAFETRRTPPCCIHYSIIRSARAMHRNYTARKLLYTFGQLDESQRNLYDNERGDGGATAKTRCDLQRAKQPVRSER